MVGDSDEKALFICISILDIGRLGELIAKYPLEKQAQLTSVFDESGYTLIHAAAYYNSWRILEMLLKIVYDALKLMEQDAEMEIKKWVNMPTSSDEGFYPLHFSSFHGNPKLIELLVAAGANINVKNKQGINLLHVGAQGDQAYSLTYFKNHINLNDTDDEKSSPLHWACFSGSDTAIYFLLAWAENVNSQDNMGYTPLHLAVRSAEHFPTTRSIKELLIKGADKNLRDIGGKRPVDLAVEYQQGILREELV